MKNKIIGIYSITSPSGKVYIGQSWDIDKRWNRYKYNLDYTRQFHLDNSFRKYGYKNHVFTVVHELQEGVTQTVLDIHEQFYMDDYRKRGIKLLNCKEGGGGGKMHPDTIERRRQKQIGSKRSQETKSKISSSQIGRFVSDETKQKIAAAHRGLVTTQETKDKLSAAGKGKKKPAGHGANVSKALKGLAKSDAHRLALSISRKESGASSGAKNGRAKLTEAIVREIRQKYRAGSTLTQLHKEYGMSKSGMHSIVTGKNWPGIS